MQTKKKTSACSQQGMWKMTAEKDMGEEHEGLVKGGEKRKDMGEKDWL